MHEFKKRYEDQKKLHQDLAILEFISKILKDGQSEEFSTHIGGKKKTYVLIAKEIK